MPNPTERLSTHVADRYRIERHLGEGGMATVYLAHDLKHDRKVGLKVLRPELAAVIGAERFLAEIRTTANLQHPNILPLFDSGDADGQLFYVMPYVEGETLRDRIDHEKQLPVDDVVRLGAEVASALDYAHRQGVIHRDIKPENILIHDGRALVADFGIALAVSTAGSRMTETGMSVGTPHYMSPEQAMGGHEVTARSDVYSLGATLYEALVGEPPFTGATAQAIIARIVTEDPRPLRTQRKTIPEHVEGAVLTALERLPADRFATAAELGEALEGRGRVPARITARAAAREAEGVAGVRLSYRAAILAGAVMLLLVAASLWGWLRPTPAPPTERHVVRLGVLGVPTALSATAAIAPDGSAIVYADSAGGDALWIKERDEVDGRKLVALPATIYPALPGPSFSPDGNWIAYTDGKLERVPRTGGAPKTLSDSSALGGAAWLDDGTVVFNGGGRLLRTDAAGGPTYAVPTPDSLPESSIGFDRPVAVPGRRAVLIAVGQNSQSLHEVAIEVETGAVHELGTHAVGAWVVDGGILVYGETDGTVLAAPFALRKLDVTGPGVTVLSRVSFVMAGARLPDFMVSRNGTLLYAQSGGDLPTTSQFKLASVTRKGVATLLDSAWTIPVAGVGGAALSPDGTHVAVSRSDSLGDRTDVYVVKLPAGPEARLTFEGTENARPVWSPDGERILYVSDAGGKDELWARRADGSGEPVRMVSDVRPVAEGFWSPDGKWIVYRTNNTAAGKGDILAVGTQGDSTRVPLATTDAQEAAPALSPDGRWLAYESDQTGRMEIYVVPFPSGWSAGHWQVSTDGGEEPQWSHDGRTLFFRDFQSRMIAADVTTAPTFAAVARHPLFDSSPYFFDDVAHSYEVFPDDGRFLMLRDVRGGQRADLFGNAGRTILVENWLPELRAKLKG
jgi:Tol biopolymer transport system component